MITKMMYYEVRVVTVESKVYTLTVTNYDMDQPIIEIFRIALSVLRIPDCLVKTVTLLGKY